MDTGTLVDPQIGRPVHASHSTTCCIVGGGPAGMMLAYLLARRGINVTLLEAHKDFDRDFRGDTIHPAVLEILDELGLAVPLHQIRHSKIFGPTLRAANISFNPIDFRRLNVPFPYVMLIPQSKFLDFMAQQAEKFPSFRLVMTANVESLIEENGVCRGVRYQSTEGSYEVRAELTVGADGRFSKVRHLLSFEPKKTSPPMDILWLRLPHVPNEQSSDGRVLGGFNRGRVLAVFDRYDYWQLAYVFAKGKYQEVRAAGIGELRKNIAEIEPQLKEQADFLTDWHQCSLLSVEASRCERWYNPGVLLIGDAAHVMSPIGGVGINYAIMDAVAAANLLRKPLSTGQVKVSDLARVQARRELPTRVIQTIQSFVQKRVVVPALQSQATAVTIPWPVRLFFATPLLRNLPARLLGFGIRPEHVQLEC
jgi:2-polyprenyl-6-methoxyphenol hydroxylase-like FAD-dependent oxidoreductase